MRIISNLEVLKILSKPFSPYEEIITGMVLDIWTEKSNDGVKYRKRLLIYSGNKHINLMPRTSAVDKMAVMRSKKPKIYFRERTD